MEESLNNKKMHICEESLNKCLYPIGKRNQEFVALIIDRKKKVEIS